MTDLAAAALLPVAAITADWVSAAAALLTVIAAAFAIGYAHQQLSAAKEASRVELTFRLYEHQLNPEFAAHIALTADFITISEKGAQRERLAERRWERWNDMDRSDQTQIVLYLNHLEAVGGLYEQKRLDEKAALRFFGQAAAVYWDRADWFIERARKPDNPEIFDKWEALAEAYENSKPKSA